MPELIPTTKVPDAVLYGTHIPAPELVGLADRPWYPCRLEGVDPQYDFFETMANNASVPCSCNRCSSKESDHCVDLWPHEIQYGDEECPVLIGQCSRCERVYYVSNPLGEPLA